MKAIGLCAPLLAALFCTSCTSYVVRSRSYLTDLSYAQPRPGGFTVVKRNLSATVNWDSDDPSTPRGSEAYMLKMTSLLTTAMQQLTAKANLQNNQALYNVRVSAPDVIDDYMAYVVLTVVFWREQRAAVTVTADVIEFTS
jgi:hypothetical protein